MKMKLAVHASAIGLLLEHGCVCTVVTTVCLVRKLYFSRESYTRWDYDENAFGDNRTETCG